MTYAEGKKYDGRWKEDMAYGLGLLTGPSYSLDGNWMYGKVTKQKKNTFILFYVFFCYCS